MVISFTNLDGQENHIFIWLQQSLTENEEINTKSQYIIHFQLVKQVRFDYKIGMFHCLNENILMFLVENRSLLRMHC